jgi:serine/threonine protein kinase
MYAILCPIHFIYSDTQHDSIVFPQESYTILKKIGRGSFGNVYQVADSKNCFFALKSFEFDTQSMLANAKHGFMMGQILNHPHIIKSFNFLDRTHLPEPAAYLLLELVEGQDLENMSHLPFSKAEVTQLLLQFVDAMRYALSCGFLHMDMHGGNNVMIQPTGHLTIIDIESFCALKNLLKNKSSHDQDSLLASYFDRTITEVCITIISKSNWEREEKIKACLIIKRLAWEYNEDVKEGKSAIIEHYFDRLQKMINMLSQ